MPPDLSEGPVDGLNKSVSVGHLRSVRRCCSMAIGFNYVTPEALHALWGEHRTGGFAAPGHQRSERHYLQRHAAVQDLGLLDLRQSGGARPQTWHDNQRRYARSSWMKGSHGFRFGFDLSNEHMNHWQVEAGGGPRGDFAYSGGRRQSGGPAPNQFNAFAAFLLGFLVGWQGGRSRTADDARGGRGSMRATSGRRR